MTDQLVILIHKYIPKDEISLDCTFFELGGTSIQAVNLMKDISLEIGVQVEPIDIVSKSIGRLL